MSRATRSIQVWAIYVLLLGTALAVVPNLLLSIFGVAETDEIWIKVLGVVLLVLALYYWEAARYETRNLYVASVLERLFVAAALVVFWATGAPWQLLIFAAIDAAGALWTLSALRANAEPAPG